MLPTVARDSLLGRAMPHMRQPRSAWQSRSRRMLQHSNVDDPVFRLVGVVASPDFLPMLAGPVGVDARGWYAGDDESIPHRIRPSPRQNRRGGQGADAVRPADHRHACVGRVGHDVGGVPDDQLPTLASLDAVGVEIGLVPRAGELRIGDRRRILTGGHQGRREGCAKSA